MLNMASSAVLRELAVRAVGADSLTNTFNGASPDPRDGLSLKWRASKLRHPHPGLRLPGA